MKAIRSLFERHSGREEYRRASVTLIGVVILPFLFLIAIEPTKADVAFAYAIIVSAYLLLAILTYFRLHNASKSGWWVILMGIVIPIGPMWTLKSWEWGSIALTPSGILTLVPIIIGWFATEKKRGNRPR